MEKFTPYRKLSKAKRWQINASRRGGWGQISPVTRTAPSPKAYNRKKAPKLRDDEIGRMGALIFSDKM